MTMDDVDWRRSLYVGAGLAIVAIAVMYLFVTLQVKNQKSMVGGADWASIGIQLFIAPILFVLGLVNRRNGWLTKILLVLLAIVEILWGLLVLLGFTDMQSELNLINIAVKIFAIDILIIAFIAIRACI
jgi:hypothetical protein